MTNQSLQLALDPFATLAVASPALASSAAYPGMSRPL